MKQIVLIIIVLSSHQDLLLALPSAQYVQQSVKKASQKVGVPPTLLKAICKAESNLRPDAYVHSDGGRANHAIGICQVLVLTAAGLGMRDPRCHRDFRKSQNRRYDDCNLFGPYYNALAAARFLKSKLKRYNGSWIDAISAYNAGKPTKCAKKGFFESWRYGNLRLKFPVKKPCIPGELLNRSYVDRVLGFLKSESAKPSLSHSQALKTSM